jgi:hypothetical protein
MNQKIKIIGIATIVGACVGAALGFGPLQRYKSEALLSMELGTNEYKRITELANDPVSIKQYLLVAPPPKVEIEKSDAFVNAIARGDWYKALPKVSKADSKDLPDVVLQMERDRQKEKEKENDKAKENGRGTDWDRERDDKINRENGAVYMGLRISYFAHEPVEAMELTTWLGSYFKEVATRDALRELISSWAAENRQFTDWSLEQQLKFKFETEQVEKRIIALKKLAASYPEASVREGRQVVDVRRDNEKFMSPVAQLVAAESQVIEIKEKSQKLDRQIGQHAFAAPLIEQTEVSLKQVRSGSEGVSKLKAMIAEYSKKMKTDAEQEKLLVLTADVSRISGKFLTHAQFVASPTTPTRPERPTPLMYSAILGLLFALIAALYCWRRELVSLLRSVSDLKPTDAITRS